MVSFWACLRLRAIAVPVYPPDPTKLAIGLQKLDLVRSSCGASLCLTETVLDQMRLALSLTHRWPANLRWERTDDARALRRAPRNLVDAPPDEHAVAFLQYTRAPTALL